MSTKKAEIAIVRGIFGMIMIMIMGVCILVVGVCVIMLGVMLNDVLIGISPQPRDAIGLIVEFFQLPVVQLLLLGLLIVAAMFGTHTYDKIMMK